MQILIIGCGSIGLFYAAYLVKAGYNVTLACRTFEQASLINSEGIIVEHGGRIEVAKVSATVSNAVQRGRYDIVVVAVKAYHVPQIVDVVVNAIPRQRDSLIVSVQNGIGSLEFLEQRFGKHAVAAAVTYYGAYRLGLNRVVFVGGSGIKLGQHGGQSNLLKVFASVLKNAGLNVEIVEDIDAWRWDKLIVNAAINPTTALLGVPNGYLLRTPHIVPIIECVVGEAVNVAEKLKIKLPRDPFKAVWETIEATKANKSSMLQDIEARRKTEIEYINGVIVKKGVEVGVPVPCNYTLYNLIKSLEDMLGVKT